MSGSPIHGSACRAGRVPPSPSRPISGRSPSSAAPRSACCAGCGDLMPGSARRPMGSWPAGPSCGRIAKHSRGAPPVRCRPAARGGRRRELSQCPRGGKGLRQGVVSHRASLTTPTPSPSPQGGGQSHHQALRDPPPRSGVTDERRTALTVGGPAKLVEGAAPQTGESCRPLHRLRRSPSPVSRWRSTESAVHRAICDCPASREGSYRRPLGPTVAGRPSRQPRSGSGCRPRRRGGGPGCLP
jgi:hypothetical protein